MVYADEKGEIMSPEQIANLPLQVLLLMGIVTLWRAYFGAQNARVEDLKQNYQQNLSDLRTRIVLLEARMGLNDEKSALQPIPGAKLN